MLNFLMNARNELIAVVDQIPDHDSNYVNRNDFSSFEMAQAMADKANLLTSDFRYFIPVDSGSGSYPRFDVIRAPRVGDLVSQSFNGDSYPRGKIVKISKTLKKITTDTGHIFWRNGNSGQWLVNRYASMIQGHVREQNPGF